MDELDRLLQQLSDKPDDEGLRAVVGDWLIEHGRPEQAEWLRLESVHRSGKMDLQARRQFYALDRKIDVAFRARVVRLSIDGCEAKLRAQFEYACPERWTAMAPTENPRVRACQVCKKPVHFVDSIEDGRRHAIDGHCVAVTPSIERLPGDLSRPPPMPRPMPVPGTVAVYRPPPSVPSFPTVPSAAPPAPPASWWQKLFKK